MPLSYTHIIILVCGIFLFSCKGSEEIITVRNERVGCEANVPFYKIIKAKDKKLIGKAVLLEPEPAATNQIGRQSARYEAVVKGNFGFFENSNPNYGCEGSKIFYISETISFENVTQRDSFEISELY
jgi:hypothetical protein